MNSMYRNGFGVTYGGTVQNQMKGLLSADGELAKWDTDEDGDPHHDDIDDVNVGLVQLANYVDLVDEISIVGNGPPVSFVSDLLRWFSGYNETTTIMVDLFWGDSEFSFRGKVRALKALFKRLPPPDPEDYDHGIKDTDFDKDYEAWTRAIHAAPQTAREILGRGGRDDVWQEKDEDWSKSFSVYSNPPKKRRRR